MDENSILDYLSSESQCTSNAKNENESTHSIESDHVINNVQESPFTHLPCCHCEKIVTSPEELESHSKIHGNDVAITCDKCNLLLNIKELDSHLETKTIALICKYCQKSFFAECTLLVHKSVCVKSEELNCNLCGQTFTNTSRLKNHSPLHDDNRPYSCVYCSVRYLYKDNLMRHLRNCTIMNGDAIVQFNCGKCDEKFQTKCSLKKHYTLVHNMRLIDPQCEVNALKPAQTAETYPDEVVVQANNSVEGLFKCDLCCSSYRNQYDLHQHMNDSHNEKSYTYKCRFCSKKFYRQPELSKHIRKNHSKDVEKADDSFWCKQCNYPFPDYKLFQRHCQRHKEAVHECITDKSLDQHVENHRNNEYSQTVREKQTPVPHNELIKKCTDSSTTQNSSHINNFKPKICANGVNSNEYGSYEWNQSLKTIELIEHSSGEQLTHFTIFKSDDENFPPKDRYLTYNELIDLFANRNKPYICLVCGKEFPYRANCIEHYMSHSKEKPFKCKICGQGFIRSCKLEEHLKNHDQNNESSNSFWCESCKYPFPDNKLFERHIQWHKGDIHECSTCGKYYNDVNLLANHLEEHQSHDNKSAITSESSPVNGEQKNNPLFAAENSVGENANITNDVKRSNEHIQPTSNDGNQFSAFAVFKKSENFLPNDRYLTYDELQIAYSNRSRPYICFVCGKDWAYRSNCIEHYLTHSKEKPFRCKLCGEGFVRNRKLEDHIEAKHNKSNLEYIKVDEVIDDSRFDHSTLEPRCISNTNNDKMKNHSIESDRIIDKVQESTFIHLPCHCEKIVTSRKELESHSKINGNDVAVTCNKCNLLLNTKELDSHLETKMIALICKYCQKSFFVECTLLVHESVCVKSEEVNCNMCGQTFTNSSRLKIHSPLHDDNRPYSCVYCSVRYLYKDNLVSHLRNCTIMNGDTIFQFSCGKCGKKFQTKCSLQKHYTLVHNLRLIDPQCEVNALKLKQTDTYPEDVVVQANNSVEGLFKCDLCCCSYSDQYGLLQHINDSHNEKSYRYKCRFCSKKFNLILELKKHIRKNHSDDIEKTDDSFWCRKCNYPFPDYKLFQRHCQRHQEAVHECITVRSLEQHIENRQNNEYSQTVREKQTSVPQNELVTRCIDSFITQNSSRIDNFKANGANSNKCGSYEWNRSLKTIELIEHSTGERLTHFTIFKSDDENFPPKDRYLTYNELIDLFANRNEPYICLVCGKEFPYLANCIEHYMLHSKEKPFKCKICGHGFIRSRKLEEHMKNHNQNNDSCDSFWCESCKYPFPDKKLFERHIQWHKGDIHECSPCGKYYNDFKLLVNHLKEHRSLENESSLFNGEQKNNHVFAAENSVGEKVNITGIESTFNDGNQFSAFAMFKKKENFLPNNRYLTYDELQKAYSNRTRPYICFVCGKDWPHRTNCIEHYLTHSKEKPFKCKLCGKGFIRNRKLEHHIEAKHKNSNLEYKNVDKVVDNSKILARFNDVCLFVPSIKLDRTEMSPLDHKSSMERDIFSVKTSDHCPKGKKTTPFQYAASYETPEKLIIYSIENEKILERGNIIYICGICRKKFYLKNHIYKHVLIHIKNKPYKCEECENRGFMTKKSMQKHYRNFHNVYSLNGSTSNTRRRERTEEDHFRSVLCNEPENVTIECDFSMEMLVSDDEDDTEMEIVTAANEPANEPVVESSSSHMYNRNELIDQFGNHFLELYVAPPVRNVQILPQLKNRHVVIRDEEDQTEISLTCAQCNETFENKNQISDHYSVHDMAEDPFKCATCAKVFDNRLCLQAHAKLHTESRIFQCKYCPKTFRHRRDFNDHERIHTGEKPFRCHDLDCRREFRTKKQLREHQRNHTGEKPYQCGGCLSKFNVYKALRRHKLVCSKSVDDSAEVDSNNVAELSNN